MSAAAASKRLRDKRKALGLCTRCGGPTGAFVGCESCRERTRQYMADPERRQAIKDKRKALGLCPRCGKKPDAPYICCASCRKSVREYLYGA